MHFSLIPIDFQWHAEGGISILRLKFQRNQWKIMGKCRFFKKPGGRAGLRNVACALHAASSVVCALRALLKDDLLISPSASARKFLVSRAWSCVVRRIPSGKLSSNFSRVASLFGREERL